MTLRQALDGLARRGVLVRLPGRAGGAFVAEPKIDYDLTGSAGFAEQMRLAGRRAGTAVLVARTVAAGPPIADALRIAQDAPVHQLVRVRSADGVAVVVARSWLPADLLPGLLELPLTGSLRALLGEHFGLAPQGAVEYLEPASADPDDAAALEVPTGTQLAAVERTAHAADGLPVELTRERYRADRVRLVVRTGAGMSGLPRVAVRGRRGGGGGAPGGGEGRPARGGRGPGGAGWPIGRAHCPRPAPRPAHGRSARRPTIAG